LLASSSVPFLLALSSVGKYSFILFFLGCAFFLAALAFFLAGAFFCLPLAPCFLTRACMSCSSSTSSVEVFFSSHPK
jgi:hypothetical protein